MSWLEYVLELVHGNLVASEFLILLLMIFPAYHSIAFRYLWSTKQVSLPPGASLLKITDFFFSPRKQNEVFMEIVTDMREEYFEALYQNRIWKARWVRIRGTWSFFAAMGLDRAFAFVSFFIKAWKSVN